MRFRTAIVIGLLLLMGMAVFTTSALQSPTNGADQDSNRGLQLPVTVKQLQPENGSSVELVCGTASVTCGNTCAIKQCLQRGRKGIPDAVAGLDLAIDGLYPHIDFHKMGRKFYHRTIEGTLKPEQEKRLRKLGVKI